MTPVGPEPHAQLLAEQRAQLLSPEQRAQLLDDLGRAVIATDADGRVTYWNVAAESAYGWSADEAIGQQLADLTLPEFNRDLATAIRSVVMAEESWSGGVTMRRKDGSLFTALVAHTAVRDDTGDMSGLVAVSSDIGHLLRPLLSQSDEAVVVTGIDSVARLVSPPAERVLGWRDTDLVGCSLLELVHPEQRGDVRGSVLRSVSDPGECQSMVFRSRTASGAWAWVEGLIDNLLDDVSVLGLVWTLRRPGAAFSSP